MTRKQREIKEREARILKLARPILLREGLQGLSMDRLAAEMEYAKGTLYNHFPNKEDIVVALAVESINLRMRMIENAAMHGDNPRTRLIHVGAASELYSTAAGHFAMEAWIRNSTIWDKASPERQEFIKQTEVKCMGIVVGLSRDAVARGDLALSDGLTVEEVIFGFWSITYGSQMLTATSPSLESLGITNPFSAIRRHCYMLMNSFDWKPIMPFSMHSELMTQEVQRLKKLFGNELF